jgi:hypothetical protein
MRANCCGFDSVVPHVSRCCCGAQKNFSAAAAATSTLLQFERLFPERLRENCRNCSNKKLDRRRRHNTQEPFADY